MYLSTTHSTVNGKFNDEPISAFKRCFELIKGAGYDRVDISFWGLSVPDKWFMRDGWEETVAEIGELAKAQGLPIHQTHANTYSGKQWDDPNFPGHEFMLESCMRAVKATALVGGKWVVMHPMNLPNDPLYNREKARDAAIRQLAPYIEEAKKLGVGIAVENMVDFRGYRRRYCAGDIYELIDLVDTVNDDSVGICLDTGHANLGGIDSAAAIYEIGKRLKATHINDNHGGSADEHLFPYFGNLDWQNISKALTDVGYDGDFAYEAGSRSIPDELLPYWLEYTARLGRYIMK